MKEIDFDELDRAVSSLMGEVKTDGNPNNDPATGEPVEKIIELDDLKESIPKEPTEAAASSDVTPVAKPPAPAIRRSGRFMDVVHPSSDMKKVASGGLVSRQGNDIVPPGSRKPDVSEESISLAEPEEIAAAAEPKDQIFTPQTEKMIAAPDSIEIEEQQKPTSDSWPDPIDLAMDEKEPDTATDTESVVDSEKPEDAKVEITEFDKTDDESDSESPLSSPFISDAKVEKRPLGGYPTDSTLPSDGSAVNVSNEDDTSAQTPVELNLPAELGADVMAVEAAQSESEEPKQVSEPIEVIHAEPVEEPKTHEATDKISGSIPQQYKEEPSSDSGETGAIYDTATYHKPLEHPATKKSGWGVVLWILGLILLGGIGGVAYFYFTTGNKLF